MCSIQAYTTSSDVSPCYDHELEPAGTEVELVPGFRVIVLTGPCPGIFEGGVEFWIAGVFSK